MSPQISILSNELGLKDPALFNESDPAPLRLLVGRVLGVEGVESVTLEPEFKRVRIGYAAEPGQRKAFLTHLVEATQSNKKALSGSDLPEWDLHGTTVLVKSGGKITSCTLEESSPGQWLITSPRLQGDERDQFAQRAIKSLQRLTGVRSVRPVIHAGVRRLGVACNPAKISVGQLIRTLEHEWIASSAEDTVKNPAAKVPMTVSSTTVGLGAVGELLLPVATPLAAGVLVATNLGVVREAGVQLTRGKVGVPLFHTALLTCSIVTGQVLAFALTDWSLRYWQRRWRRQLGREYQNLVDNPLKQIAEIRRVDGQGNVQPMSVADVTAGITVRVLAGEVLPLDGHVVAGEALLDEKAVGGSPFPIRKSAGDEVLAGTLLLAGGLELKVSRTLPESRAGRMAEAIGHTADSIASSMSLQKKAETLADKTALPTLATAGVGWVAGDLITVGAILHQDWVSGPALAVPLLTLRHVAEALKYGAVIQNPNAFTKLAACDFVVLDGDDPALAAASLEVREIRSKLPESVDSLLRHIASAGIYLGGDVALALLEACRARDLVVRQTELLALEPNGVLAQVGESRLHLSLRQDLAGPIVSAELNGKPVADVVFGKSAVLAAAKMVGQLQAAGLQVFMASSATEAEANALAQSLGITLFGSELNPAERLQFLDGLKRRGVTALYAGRVSDQPEINSHASVTVAVEGLEQGAIPADVVMTGRHYDRLPELIEQARRYDPDIRQGTRAATIPNLLCVAGGFGGVLNGITSGIIANVGVMNVDRHIQRKLASTKA
ncbi:MAG: hypothetical protein K9K68_02025 [Methylococcaceae bacterium]|nr:hypothetical protein [Methylococcaceae bacterium]